MIRSSRILLLLVCLSCTWAVEVAAQSPPLPQLEAHLLAGGLDFPTWAGSPPGDKRRVFVLEVAGRVRLIKDGVLLAAPFLDITDKAEQGAQSGLLGMAFHPDFANNGWFYLYYAISGKSSNLERYTVSTHDSDKADPTSALPMLAAPIVQPAEFHMGGGMAFGPDGMLYVAIGDIRDIATATCAAQRLDSLLGKVLRLTDDGTIPHDNPFVNVPGARGEIWDLGLREPYKMAFDPETGDLTIGDVGEATREELNLHPAGTPGGVNFGWRVMEGELCTGSAQCASFPCPDAAYTLPIYSYSHENAQCCILGGGVYRGAGIFALRGSYLFSDFCSQDLYSLRLEDPIASEPESVTYTAPSGAISQLSSIGFDADGEPLLVDFGINQPGQGEVWRLSPKAIQDIGGGLGGPTLTGEGELAAGKQVTLTLADALPVAPAHFVVGLDTLALPFKGGILVPTPDVVISGFFVGTTGTLGLSAIWPAGVPTGQTILLQWWIADPSGPQGFTASNALIATTH